jgi:hypothetical protein
MEDYDDSDYLTEEELEEWNGYMKGRREWENEHWYNELFDDDLGDYESDYEYQRSLMTRTERWKYDFWFWWWNTKIGNKMYWWKWNLKNKQEDQIPF